MGRLMHDALGIGLAATQVGVMHRVLVYRVGPRRARGGASSTRCSSGPSEEREPLEEGCLSLPGVLVEVERPMHVRVRARDEHGEEQLIEASGLEARVLQHEMDHLDGVLILDRTTRDQRKQAMRALREAAPARRPSASAPRSPRAHRLPRHLELRRHGARAARGERAPPGARDHAPGRAAGPRPAPAAAARRRRRRARSASS